jgi:predicted small secreted protein
MKRFLLISTMLVVGFSGLALSACNTTKGFGQDMKKGGQALENSAERHGAD